MNDLKTLTAQPSPMTVDGETYLTHPLTIEDWGALQAWLDRQHPNPLELVKETIAKGGFNRAQEQYLLEKALEKASKPRTQLGSPEADQLLMSVPGWTQVLYLSIKKGRPGFTEQDAALLAAKLSFVDVAQMARNTTLDMVASDPKDEPLTILPKKTNGSAASRKRKRREIGG